MAGEPIEVAMLDLEAQDGALRREIEAAWSRVASSGRFILGSEGAALEEALAERCGARHAVGCASGSDALLLSLMALSVGPGDQVVLPSFSFFSSASCVVRLGADPVFVDVDPATYNVDPDCLERAARSCRRPKVLLPVHLFGQAADRSALRDIAGRLGLPVVEDAAQALGAVDAEGQPIGAGAEATCFSFYPTKNLGAYGDAGMICSDDDALAARLRLLRNQGMEPRYLHRALGINSRLDELQAAVLRVKLPHLEAWNAARRANADRYDALFAEAGARDSRNPLEQAGLPLRFPCRPPAPGVHTFHQYTIRVPAELRDALRSFLAERHIATEIYYPLPLHLQECFAHLGLREGALPHSERAAREILCLPIHPGLRKEQLEHVASSVIGFLGRRGG